MVFSYSFFVFSRIRGYALKKLEGVKQGRRKTWTENRRREGKGSNEIMKMKVSGGQIKDLGNNHST